MGGSETVQLTPAIAKPRGRQRSLAAEAAILNATLALLKRHSLADLTADAIATRAKVSKATIYKWWPNKNRVALDAVLSGLKADVPIPDTGSFREDFTQHFKASIHFYQNGHGKIALEFLTQSQNDPELLKLFRERLQQPRRTELKIMFDRAVARGEIRADADVELIIDLFIAPMVYRMLAGHIPVDDLLAHSTMHIVFHGLCARH